ncbi:unnamed protein product [Brachionus calyciflorus]|uniref:Uncharacterized protein n=1 Tax=Brachionus calyciflorus TaxID=104777 RepID=A0A814NGZ3_9BILA|nr:unnamed protein product [Brachionus calyciflorus]
MTSWLQTSLFLSLFAKFFCSRDFFVPFGTENGDAAMFKNDDQFTRPIQIATLFPFFNRTFSFLIVSTNGLITFDNGVGSYNPSHFPLKEIVGITPFWNDINTNNGGDIFYREINDTLTLSLIASDIQNSFTGFNRFRPKWAFVATWFQVAQFQPSDGLLRNTFQAILTTNGVNSFAIFNYDRLAWSISTNIETYAQAGFNAGDGTTFYVLNGSFTPDILNVAMSSNIQKPGKWIFGTDLSEITDGICRNGGLITLDPYVVFYFGGEDILVSGPCFLPGVDTAKISINSEEEIDCGIIDFNKCKFTMKFVDKIGRVSIKLNLNEQQTFEGSILTKDESVIQEIRGLKTFYNSFENEEIRLEWNTNDFDLFDLYLIRLDNSKSSVVKLLRRNLTDNYVYLNSSELYSYSNESEYEYSYLALETKSQTRAINSPIRKFFTAKKFYIFNKLEYVSNEKCVDWHNKQPEPKSYIQALPPCWPSVPLATWSQVPHSFDNFVLDPACNPSKPNVCQEFHSGAFACYRSATSFKLNGYIVGQQCCYDSQNKLLVGPPGGGTLDMAHSSNVLEHFLSEVFPYFLCCKWSSNCDKYYDKRPSDNGDRWTPPRPAGGSGALHFTTFDGLSYTFNGFGEYTFLEIQEKNFTVQIRLAPLSSSNEKKPDGTVIKGIAIKGDIDIDSFQVELDANNKLFIYVNGELIELDEKEDQDISLNGINIRIPKTIDKIDLTYAIGVHFEIVFSNQKNAFLVYTTISQEFISKTRGLLGNFNKNKQDDFTLPNGTSVSLDPGLDRDVFSKFGQYWLTNEQSSIFVYDNNLTQKNYVDVNFLPRFMQDGVDFTDSTLALIAKEKCGNNSKCLFDISATKDVNIGQMTLDFDEKVEIFNQEIERIQSTMKRNDGSLKNSNNVLIFLTIYFIFAFISFLYVLSIFCRNK